MSYFVKCRCGREHPIREREILCTFCKGPTWDFHGVCGRCRALETLAALAERVVDHVEANQRRKVSTT